MTNRTLPTTNRHFTCKHIDKSDFSSLHEILEKLMCPIFFGHSYSTVNVKHASVMILFCSSKGLISTLNKD